MSDDLVNMNPENKPLYEKLMGVIRETCNRIEGSGVPVEVCRQTEAKAMAEIKNLLEDKSPEEIKDLLAFSVYMNIAAALDATTGEEVGVNV